MEVINYFKIRGLIEISITQSLKDIFIKRFKKERYSSNNRDSNNLNNNNSSINSPYYISNNNSINSVGSNSSEWSNSKENINFILNSFPPDKYQNFTIIEKEIISDGKIELFTFNILCNLLLNLKYSYNERETIRNQNEIIYLVKVIYYEKVFNNRDFKVSDGSTLSYLVQINEKFKSFASDAIDDIIKSLSSLNLTNHDSTNEEMALKAIERTDALLKDSKYPMVYQECLLALNYSGISYRSKSLLNLNGSIALFNLSKQGTFGFLQGKISPDNREYSLLMKAKEMAITSILYQPDSHTPYFSLGMILSKISEYQLAIEILESALLLNTSHSYPSLITTSIKEARSKLLVIQNSIRKSDGSRNYEKETLSILKDSCFNRFIEVGFKEMFTDEYAQSLYSQFSESTKNEFIKCPINDGSSGTLSANKLLELNIYLQVLKNKSLFESNRSSGTDTTDSKKVELTPDQCTSIFGRLVASDTQLSRPYYEILNHMVLKSEKKCDQNLIFALIMKISTLPVPYYFNSSLSCNQQYQCSNYEVVNMQETLGTVYKIGAINQDIDLQKSKYYYQLSIKNCINSPIPNELKSQYGSTSYAYYSLGVLSFIKPLANILRDSEYLIKNLNSIDINKLCLYWKLGSSISGSQFSSLCLEKFNCYSAYINKNSGANSIGINSYRLNNNYNNYNNNSNKNNNNIGTYKDIDEKNDEKDYNRMALLVEKVDECSREWKSDELNQTIKEEELAKESRDNKLVIEDVMEFQFGEGNSNEVEDISNEEPTLVNQVLPSNENDSAVSNVYIKVDDAKEEVEMNENDQLPVINHQDLEIYTGSSNSGDICNSLIGKFIYKEFHQSIDFVKVLELNSHQETCNQYIKSLYRFNLQVEEFIKAFKRFKAFEDEGIEFLNEDRVDLIKPLSNLYCKLELASSIRMEGSIKKQLVEFLDSLIIQAPNDKSVRLVYIVLNLFNKAKYSEIVKIANISAPLVSGFPSTSLLYSRSFSNKYKQAFAYYLVIIHIINNELNTAFKKSICYELEFNNCSYLFNYLVFNLLSQFGPQRITLSTSSTSSTPSSPYTIFQNIFENGEEYATNSLLSGNPLKIHYFNLIAIVLINHIHVDQNYKSQYLNNLNNILLNNNQINNYNHCFINNVQKERNDISRSILNYFNK